MKKSILFILFAFTLISCSEEKEVKLMPLTSKSDSAVKLMREYMENFEQRKWYDNEGVMDSILKLDPEFSMALAWWDPFLEREVRRTNIIKAYNNREGLSEFESLFIEGVYQRRVNGDIKKMDSILK